jgi:hypothetical protein
MLKYNLFMIKQIWQCQEQEGICQFKHGYLVTYLI